MGTKYIVKNKSNSNIQLIIPAPYESRRSSAAIVLESSMSIDILPYAGSVAACRRISQLEDLRARNLIDIIEVSNG